jgi:hypothetical protein
MKNCIVMTAVLAVQWSTRYSTKLSTRFLLYSTYNSFQILSTLQHKAFNQTASYCTEYSFQPPSYSTL